MNNAFQKPSFQISVSVPLTDSILTDHFNAKLLKWCTSEKDNKFEKAEAQTIDQLIHLNDWPTGTYYK